MDAVEVAAIASGAAGVIGASYSIAKGARDRTKEAEAKGRQSQRFEDLREKVDKIEARVEANECSMTELEKAFSNQELLLKQLNEKMSEISADLKELVRSAARRRVEDGSV